MNRFIKFFKKGPRDRDFLITVYDTIFQNYGDNELLTIDYIERNMSLLHKLTPLVYKYDVDNYNDYKDLHEQFMYFTKKFPLYTLDKQDWYITEFLQDVLSSLILLKEKMKY